VTHALEAAQNLELLLKRVEIVVEQVKRQCNKVFSLSNVLAINVMGLVKKLNLLVEPVVVRALLGIKKTLSVKIPAGVDTGNRIRLSGEGEAGLRGGPHGDLYVQIHIKEHAIFERDGNDLYCEVPIDFATSALGGSIEVPTLKGKLKINVPAGTQTSKLFRLRGKGMPAMRHSGSGDLLCQVKVETPVNLNSKQKKLLKDFSNSCEAKHHPESDSFFGKMKSFFE